MSLFKGVDLLIDCWASSDSLKVALETSLGVARERIFVIRDLADYPRHNKADLVCVVTPLKGEFHTLLSLQTDGIEAEYNALPGLIQRVCNILGCRCLLPDVGPEPYSMLLLSDNMPPERVELDPEALDQGRYILKR
jgi:hypothetical protein